MIETDLELDDGRTLHVHDTGPDDTGLGDTEARLTVFWHHGTPNIGAPPKPLFPAAARHGVRWVGYDRPGYGGSSPRPGRSVATAAEDVARIADHLGIDRFAVMGHSGGGPHALACGALLPERVSAVVCGAALAPFHAEGLDWFAGMSAPGAASLRAAAEGRAAKEAHEAHAEFDPDMFTEADHAALAGAWSWFQDVVGPAVRNGPGPLIDDDLAYVAPWGFDPAGISVPVLILHGGQDRMVPAAHGRWLAEHCPTAELRLRPDDGHISVLDGAPSALDWLADRHAK